VDDQMMVCQQMGVLNLVALSSDDQNLDDLILILKKLFLDEMMCALLDRDDHLHHGQLRCDHLMDDHWLVLMMKISLQHLVCQLIDDLNHRG
jgi:hypothetical protein